MAKKSASADNMRLGMCGRIERLSVQQAELMERTIKLEQAVRDLADELGLKSTSYQYTLGMR